MLKVHLVNAQENLQKTTIPENSLFDDSKMSDDNKFEHILRDLNDKKGCRVKSCVKIDRATGDFHFSWHGYGYIIQRVVSQFYSTNCNTSER